MDERDYSEQVRDIEMLTSQRSFVELKTNGLLMMRFGLIQAGFAALCAAITVGMVLAGDVDMSQGAATIFADLLTLFYVLIVVGLVLFIIGAYVQMKNLVESVKACQRAVLVSDLDKMR